jgi:CBS domain-containing protein
MTQGVETARTDTLRAVANLMRGRTIGGAPVVEGHRLVGIVTITDLLEALGRGIDRPAPGTRPIAPHPTPHRKPTRVRRAW